MKQMLNTLFVTSPECMLSLNNNAVIVQKSNGEKTRIVSNLIDSIYCFGARSVTVPLATFCAQHGISLVFLTKNGRFCGRFAGEVNGNVELRSAQYQALDHDHSLNLHLIRSFLTAKLTNARTVLMRAARESTDSDAATRLSQAADAQSEYLMQIKASTSPDAIRAAEGMAAAAYFDVFPCMIKPGTLTFSGRNRRPPRDEMNALMSFLYTLLKNDVQSALEAVGLDPECGAMHAMRPGRPALALDMMEELRAPLCDRLALSLVNRRQITADYFIKDEENAVLLNEKGRDIVLKAWQQRKAERMIHPVLDEKISVGQIAFCQAKLLACFIRGTREDYPPFLWR